MTKIVADIDCGNAPKKQYVLDFNTAYAKADIDIVLDMIEDDAGWIMIGSKTLTGKENIKSYLIASKPSSAKELFIENIISHGKVCAANGTRKYGDSTIAFCDVYTFSNNSKNAKIAKITSYTIPLGAV